MQFNFENAFAHFARTGAPRGFVWKFALSYVAFSILFGAIAFVVMGGWYASLFQAYGSQDPDQILAASQMSGGLIAFVYLVLVPLSLFFYAVFEASYLRRYMRQDRFFLKIGKDEWNVFVVLLIWVAYFIIAMIVLSILSIIVMIPFMAAAEGQSEAEMFATTFMIGLIVPLILLIPMGLLAIRFSPAAAMTIRDRRIRFLSAWSATKGKFWTLLGAYAAWFALGFVAYMIVSFIMVLMMMPMFASMASLETGGELNLSAFGFSTVLGLVFYVLLLAAGACFYYVWAGPAALAAKVQDTDDHVEHQRVAMDM